MWARVVRFRYMITEKAKERARILSFWEKHGEAATKEAFSVSRRTLFRWQKKLRERGGKLEGLNAGKTTPNRRRKRIAPAGIEERIISFRGAHPRLGKDKLHAILKRNGYEGSVSTVGRILADLGKKGKLPSPAFYSLYGKTGRLIEKKPRKNKKKLRRPKGYRVLEVDTIVRYLDGVKRYVLTAVDTETRTAFAAAYTRPRISKRSRLPEESPYGCSRLSFCGTDRQWFRIRAPLR